MRRGLVRGGLTAAAVVYGAVAMMGSSSAQTPPTLPPGFTIPTIPNIPGFPTTTTPPPTMPPPTTSPPPTMPPPTSSPPTSSPPPTQPPISVPGFAELEVEVRQDFDAIVADILDRLEGFGVLLQDL